jgi:thiamine-monophosphate kinase
LLPCRKGCSTDQALSDGEDYELLFTISAKKVAKLEAAWKVAFPKLRLTQIGQLVDDEVDPLGGWDHFA